MKIRITFEVDDRQREAIRKHWGEAGKATYDECKNALHSWVHLQLETIVDEYGIGEDNDDE